MEAHIKNIILKYLSYQDADVSEEQKARMRDYGMTYASSHRYGISLNELFNQYGDAKVHAMAKVLHADFIRRMKFFVNVSAQGASMSWTYWDLAKQFYFFKNPNQQKSVLYRIADPMMDQILQREMVCRQMGWEIYHSEKRQSIREKLSRYPLALEYLAKSPKTTKELRSWDYANLGCSVRNIELHAKVSNPVQTFTLLNPTPYREVTNERT